MDQAYTEQAHAYDNAYVTLSFGRYLLNQKREMESKLAALQEMLRAIQRDETDTSSQSRQIYDWKKKAIFTEITNLVKLLEIVHESIVKTKLDLRRCLYHDVRCGMETSILAFLQA